MYRGIGIYYVESLPQIVQSIKEVKPHIFGKIATFFQMVTIIWVLSGASVRPFLGLVLAAAFCTFTSGVIYIFDGLRQLEKTAAAHRHSHDHPPA